MIENDKETIFKGMMKEWLDPPYIPVIAFGGAGAHFLKSFERLLSIYKNENDPEDFSNIFTMYVNTKQETSMDTFPFSKTVLITNSFLGLHSDTNGYVEVGEKIVEDNFDDIFNTYSGKISINLRKADAVVLVAAFGGGMGTGGIKEAIKLISLLEEINYNVAKKIIDIILHVKNEKENVFKELYGKIFEEEFQEAVSSQYIKEIKTF